MPYIHPDTVDKVRSTAVILDIVGNFVSDLKKVGSNFRAKSPFTDEKTPSFYVNPAKNIFKCFSSGKGGDAIKFLMELEKYKFHEAVGYIADYYGISQKSYTPTEEEKEQIDLKEKLFQINEAAGRQYQKQLWYQPTYQVDQEHASNFNWAGLPSLDANAYELNLKYYPIYQELIIKRELTSDSIIEFELGYAPDQWRFLADKLKEQALNTQAATLGLVGQNQSKHYFDKLRHRITFPIRDHDSRLIGFGAAALYKEWNAEKEKPVFFEFIDGVVYENKQGERQPVGKYINSPESPIYDKSSALYGIHLAKEAIRKLGYAYLTEGYFDVITPHQHGLTNTVSTCGTALTKKQIELLLRYTDRIIIFYDGDNAGRTNAIKAAELLINEGLSAEMVELPDGEDPDSHFRHHPSPIKYIQEHTRHALLCKADFELTDDLNDGEREFVYQQIANLISAIDGESIKDTLIKTIAKAHGLTTQVFRKMVTEHTEVRRRKSKKDRMKKRKNEVVKLEGKPEVYPFFEEKTKDGDFKGIEINKKRFIKLLASFGYSRYEIGDSDTRTFVRISDNLIDHVKRDDIIDHFEDFVENEYNFDEAGFEHVDSEQLLNKFYSGIRTYFSSDIFGRVRNSQNIIINADTKHSTFFYFQNGFVEVNAEGWKLNPYHQMEGGIWSNQVNQRDFQFYEMQEKSISPGETGVFSDFVWRISGEDDQRFLSLCSILGYLVHDFYHYKLQLVNFTDSSLSRASDGRSGKTLLTKMIGHIRNVGEINGKEFRASDKNKYADLDLYTQITVINDIVTKGMHKLYFEDLFNDITEGQMVKKLYMDPFRIMSKMIINSNGPLDIQGGSAADRVIEYELSQYFNTKRSPLDEYGIYLGHDFDDREWMLYDNFMCFCAFVFHQNGVVRPAGINLGRRKLIRYVNEWVLKFLDQTKDNLETHKRPWEDFKIPSDWPEEPTLCNIRIDKKMWYEQMLKVYSEIDSKQVTLHKFTKFLQYYAKHMFGIENPIDKRSGGTGWFIMQEAQDS